MISESDWYNIINNMLEELEVILQRHRQTHYTYDLIKEIEEFIEEYKIDL